MGVENTEMISLILQEVILWWLFIRVSSNIYSYPHNRRIFMIIYGEHKFHLRYGNPVTDKTDLHTCFSTYARGLTEYSLLSL